MACQGDMAILFCKPLFLNWPRRKSCSTDCFDILHSASLTHTHGRLCILTGINNHVNLSNVIFFHAFFLCVIIVNHVCFPGSHIATCLKNYKKKINKKKHRYLSKNRDLLAAYDIFLSCRRPKCFSSFKLSLMDFSKSIFGDFLPVLKEKFEKAHDGDLGWEV